MNSCNSITTSALRCSHPIRWAVSPSWPGVGPTSCPSTMRSMASRSPSVPGSAPRSTPLGVRRRASRWTASTGSTVSAGASSPTGGSNMITQHDATTLRRVSALPVDPWAGGVRPAWMRLGPRFLTGAASWNTRLCGEDALRRRGRAMHAFVSLKADHFSGYIIGLRQDVSCADRGPMQAPQAVGAALSTV